MIGLVLTLSATAGLAAQRTAVPRGGGSGGGGSAEPSSQGSSPAPQGARAPSGSGDSGRSSAPAPRSGRSSGTSNAEPSSGDAGTRAVPYARPRTGNPNGVAVARTAPPPVNDPDGRSPIFYYYPVGYYPLGYGGYGFGGYYGGYYGGLFDPWGYGYGYPGDYYAMAFADDGALRLKVKPNDASVYVDGYFAGRVDDFDGIFQRLRIGPGPHRIEVRADGYEPLFFDVRILPDRTITYSGELKKF